LPSLVPEQNFYVHDLAIHNIQNDHSFLGCQLNTLVVGSVASFWFGLGIKRGAEIVTAPAAVHDSQPAYLGCQFRIALSREQRLKLMGKVRECIGEQWE